MREWVVLQKNLGAERHSARKYLIIMVICISLSVIPAYAESAGEGWSGTVVEAGSIIQTLSLTGGAVGLAWCGIEYAYGSEETSRRAKSKATSKTIFSFQLSMCPLVVCLLRMFPP